MMEQKKQKAKYVFEEKLGKMQQDKRKHIQIIALYWQYKEIILENEEQYKAILARDLKPSRQLVGFPLNRILEVMDFLENENDMKWTMETILKYITDDLDNLQPIKNKKYV